MGENFTKKEQIVILLIGITIISLLGFKVLGQGVFKPKANSLDLGQKEGGDFLSAGQFLEEKPQEPGLKEGDQEDQGQEDLVGHKTIMVHISGQVGRPGLVVLKEGQRLVDAVDQAGGLKDEADLDRINLAKKLNDEDKIYIPAQGEDLGPEDLNQLTSSSDQALDETKGRININTCDQMELQSLPGIGQVLAGRIIDYRTASPFQAVEDLLKVAGIGDKKFQDIKDLVTIK